MKSARPMLLAVASAIAATLAAPLQAVTLPLDGAWSTFQFDGSSSAWHLVGDPREAASYEFTLDKPAQLQVSDTFFSGDQFEVFNLGISLEMSSTPAAAVADVGTFDLAFGDPEGRWSRARYLLGPGSYSISGVTSVSSFPEGGIGGIRIASITANTLAGSSNLVLAALSVGALAITYRRRDKR